MSSSEEKEYSTGGEEELEENDEEVEESEEETAENDDYMDLGASETESDNENEDDEDCNEPEEKKPKKKSRSDIVKEDVLKRYEDRKGKQLYIRFPHKLPESEEELQQKLKSLSPQIVKAHKPRQKHARFCLVDYSSKDERDNALKKLRITIKKDDTLKGTVVSIPRTESDEYVQELADKKVQSLEAKQAKYRLKRASKLARRDKNFTPSVVVLNLPQKTSIVEIRQLFPAAVDIQLRTGKGKMHGANIAAITLPSTMEARQAVKKNLSLGGNKLTVRFDKLQNKNDKRKPSANGDKTKRPAGVKAAKPAGAKAPKPAGPSGAKAPKPAGPSGAKAPKPAGPSGAKAAEATAPAGAKAATGSAGAKAPKPSVAKTAKATGPAGKIQKQKGKNKKFLGAKSSKAKVPKVQ